jgi:putative aminopeptidase
VSPQPILYLLAIALLAAAPSPTRAVDLTDEIEAFLRVPAVAGREEPAREFVRQRLPGLPVETDKAGNVVLTIGSGSPRRLVACPLGEPGFAVTGIQPDGYLRLFPTTGDPVGALWEQAHEGNVVMIGGSRGLVPGAVTLRSAHLMQDPNEPEPKPFRIGEAYVDVGAESAAEVADLGIRLLDPVSLIRRPVRLQGALLAGPTARTKGACVAAIEAARVLSGHPGKGTTVFAWTANDLVNGAAVAFLIRQRGPFDELVALSPLFGWSVEDNDVRAQPLPAPGSGLLGIGQLPGEVTTREAAHPPLDRFAETLSRDSGQATRLGALGLPVLYLGTPVETIAVREVSQLVDALVRFGGGKPGSRPDPPALPPPPALAPSAGGHEEVAPLLSTLMATPGVSGAEGLVREEIRKRLPAWAKPETDAKGNLLVTFGQGDEHSLFVAHMDEVGFRVTEVLPDGRLKLETRGGLLSYVWEAQAAQVHGERGPVPAVFEPREDWRTAAERRSLPDPPTVYLGVASAREAEALGVRVGSTVTMPKEMFRLGRHRGVGRGFDDRNGCTALLLALQRIDPAKLARKVTFAWVVEEEVGLVGSRDLAQRMTDLTRVHPVDTFVSADTPRESRQYAYAPLGQGAVLRTMDNATLLPRELIDRYLALAGRAGIPVQYGFTGGASDGVAFLPNGVEMIPFSWPGRSSHSPVEISDFRDVESLVRLVVAAATE